MLNNHIRFAATALLAAFLVTGCVSAGNVAMKEQNQQTIEQTIIKGKTNKQEIFGRFGSADGVSFTDSGNEIWTYRHTRSKPMARNFIPYNFFSLGKIYRPKNLSFYLTAKA
ncbi:hypothetical protein [Moraxella nonliquefaciens]|uniref:hypothetical protein n=1 Tax=Moraxella nonliquefaciens TaxID=478 RepID=UPI003EE23DB8